MWGLGLADWSLGWGPQSLGFRVCGVLGLRALIQESSLKDCGDPEFRDPLTLLKGHWALVREFWDVKPLSRAKL